ncbi:MAG: hypothetical protein IMY70_00620 [Bacteroidetes bacterium]|nr:hypothetical protein [Bacteroidota bacterium]
MKNLIFISILTCTLFSCSKDDEFDFEQYPQKWQLIKMTGQIPNSETTGTNMEWQEYYILNSNGTFTKSRERRGILTEVSGTFVFKDLSDKKYLELTYESDNAIIGSCFSEPGESLWLKSENRLMGTWSYCDGPGLEYERIK